jgi:hypothetical protein
MISFDLITDEAFRACLESDYAELNSCLQAKAWKSAHVSAGSIVEAVLIDYLLFLDSKKTAKTDPLKMDLATAISTSQKEGVISEKTAHLCSAVKDYRNLIHPGRSIRLGETIDENSASVAHALVGIVVAEVSAKKKETYGYTAEQLVAKLEADPSVTHIFRHLMEGMQGLELKRLLLKVIPPRHAKLSEEHQKNADVLSALERCFQTAFEMADEPTREETARRLVSVIKKEPGEIVLWYETAFFQPAHLKYLSDSEARLVKGHIMRRPHVLESEDSLRLVQSLEEYITPEEANEFIAAISFFAIIPGDERLRNQASAYFVKLPSKMSYASKVVGAQKIGQLVGFLRKRGYEDDARKLEEYQKAWDTALALEGLTDALKKMTPPNE